MLLILATGAQKSFLPEVLAGKLGHNSEAFCYALALSAWIQFALPRLSGRRRISMALLAAVILALGATGLLVSELPSSIRTLNEPLVAIALLVIYTALPRPRPRFLSFTTITILGVVLVVGAYFARPTTTQPEGEVNLVTQQVEAVALVLLTVVALDLIDRGILDPTARTSTMLRWIFYAGLVAIPAAIVVIGPQVRQGSDAGSVTLDVIGRSLESFIGVLVLCLYFAVLLGRTGVRSDARRGDVNDNSQLSLALDGPNLVGIATMKGKDS